MKKWVIWDLFGGSQKSVAKALAMDVNVEIHTIDIFFNKSHYFRETNHYLDLTDLDKAIAYLHKLPKPDIIFASPMCRAFSSILVYGERYWRSDLEKFIRETIGIEYDPRTKSYYSRGLTAITKAKLTNNFFAHLNPEKVQKNAVEGLTLLENTLSIIDCFKPKYWYIENPEKSIMWDVIRTNHKTFINHWNNMVIMNKTYYSGWDETFSLKPTIFLSNIHLSLDVPKVQGHQVRPKGCRMVVSGGENGKRVMIPKQLIKTIFERMKAHYEKSNQ